METAILTGLFVIVGVLIGGALQIEAARRARLGDQQLEAATEFQVTSTAFFTALDRRARELDLSGPKDLTDAEKGAWLAASRASVDDAREDARRMLSLLARIELVFGPFSTPATHAGAAIKRVHELIEILEDEGQPRADELGETWIAAVDSFGQFRQAAYEAFSRPVWHWRKPEGTRPNATPAADPSGDFEGGTEGGTTRA